MGRFKGKSSSEAKAKRDFVRINPYEIPEKALAVIANICSKNNTDDTNPIIRAVKSELSKKGSEGLNFYEFIDNDHYRKELFNFDLLNDVKTQLSEITQELLAHENTNDTQVVVAGGFSAGKSSFLNALTGAGDLLPTGIDPCSMVQTYLYCSSKTTEIVVKAINLKDAIVRLDKDVLQSIQHESKSKVYLASVLDKLFVEVPSESLDGFVFIDTPGYNNSDKKNDTNNSTDEETAQDAVNRGNVLLWVIDAGAGTIPKKDMEWIRNFINGDKSRKVAIVFNKADKKGETETEKIVREAYSMVSDLGNAVIDVFGFSSQENRIYYSYRGYSVPRLLQELRNSGTGNSGIQRRLANLEDLFNDEIDFALDVANENENEKKTLVVENNDAHKWIKNEKDGTKNILEWVEGVVLNTYSDVLKAASEYSDIYVELHNHVSDKIVSIYNDENSKFSAHDSVLNELNRLLSKVDSYGKRHGRVNYNYYEDDNRRNLVETIKQQLERLDSMLSEKCDDIESRIEHQNKEIEKFRHIATEMAKYRDVVKGTLSAKIREFRATAHKVQDARLDFTQTTDIFTAIRTDSYSDFLNCFVTGVKLSETNPEGYSPLTYAVKMNRTNMVKFLTNNDARLDSEDGRGMNAFLTAVENANGPLIEYFLKEEPSLADSCSAKGESAKTIAEKNSLGEWYKAKVK